MTTNNTTKKKVLLVDDSEELRTLLADRLTAEGFDVRQAKDGLEGFELMQVEKPDLVVLDLMMPAMTGEQVWRSMRQSEKLKNIPVIILTARRQYQDKYLGKVIPEVDYITKPYKPEALVKRIREKTTVSIA